MQRSTPWGVVLKPVPRNSVVESLKSSMTSDSMELKTIDSDKSSTMKVAKKSMSLKKAYSKDIEFASQTMSKEAMIMSNDDNVKNEIKNAVDTSIQSNSSKVNRNIIILNKFAWWITVAEINH